MNTAADPPKAHLYPFLIGKETLELLHGVIFYLIVVDTACGLQVRRPNGIKAIEKKMADDGVERALMDEGWDYLGKYEARFRPAVTQSGVVQVRGHWDWYVRRLRDFVVHATEGEANTQLSGKDLKDLRRIDHLTIAQQLDLLARAAGVEFGIPDHRLEAIREMELVRNIGTHNRWEVDQHYLDRTSTTGWALGDVRKFDVSEFQDWHAAILKVIDATTSRIAVRFKDAPPFP